MKGQQKHTEIKERNNAIQEIPPARASPFGMTNKIST